jgi:hypothetical protein
VKETKAKVKTPLDTVTVVSRLPDTVPLTLYHIADLNRADRLPLAHERIKGMTAGSDEPAHTEVPRWIWESWEEQHQNDPRVRDRQLYALPYAGQALFVPDVGALTAEIRRILKVEPQPGMLLNLRDLIGFLHAHIAAIPNAPRPAAVRASLRRIGKALDVIDRERGQLTRAAVLVNVRNTPLHRDAGELYAGCDAYCAGARPRLVKLEEYVVKAAKDLGGRKPIANHHRLTAEQTAASLAIEIYRNLTGRLPGKRRETAIQLCRAIWTAAGGEGLQSWLRTLKSAVAAERRGDTLWIREGLSRPR